MNTESWFKGILFLESQLSARDAKYRRNYRQFYDSFKGEDIRNPVSQPLGFYYSVDDNIDRPPPIINATKSAVNTICSTMSQLKTRPFFNPVNGKFDTRKAARDVQRYMDALFDKENVYTESPEVLRYAAIFEAGYWWVNDIDNCFMKLRPWEFFYSHSEYQYGQMKHYHIRLDHYPICALANRLKEDGDPTGFKKRFKQRYEKNMFDTCTYRVAYDLEEGYRSEFMDQYEIKKTKINFDEPNVSEIYFNRPLKGGFSTSLVDDVYTIQLQINDICRKIGGAVALTPANFVLVPKSTGGNTIKPSMIKSDIGYVYEYSPIQGAPPISIVTPAPIDPSYLQLLNFFIDQVFKQPGVSDMQALGERPQSVQSGYAIDTLNNIFSNRQNVILINYLRMQCDLARKAIKCFSETFELPSKGKKKVTMGEVKKQLELLTIDISATSSLSRDPKTKQDQIQQLVQGGLMSVGMATQYLEMPDLEDAYSVLTSAQDYNRWIIERVVKDGKSDFYQVTDLSDLFQLAVSELLQCAAAGEDDEVLDNLSTFLDVLQSNFTALQPPPPTAPPPQPGQPNQPPPGVAGQQKSGGPPPQGA
jgi:hypothetical protein